MANPVIALLLVQTRRTKLPTDHLPKPQQPRSNNLKYSTPMLLLKKYFTSQKTNKCYC